MSPLRLTLLLALLPAACQQTPEEIRGRAAMRPSIEGMASERLAPLARFTGIWEGTLEGVSGNYRLAKRVTWLVPNSWLLEQTIALDEGTGKEIDRSAVIFTIDPVTRVVEARLLMIGGAEFLSDVELRDDGMTREIVPREKDGLRTLLRTSLFNGREWRGQNFLLDESGEWREVNRFQLVRRGQQ